MDWGIINTQVERLLYSQKGVCISFMYDGNTYEGCRTMLRRDDVNTDAGLADAYSFSLLCPASQFVAHALPKPRQSKVTIGGNEYRVLAVEKDATGSAVRIHLGEALA